MMDTRQPSARRMDANVFDLPVIFLLTSQLKTNPTVVQFAEQAKVESTEVYVKENNHLISIGGAVANIVLPIGFFTFPD
jgi:hypothetical protein